MKLKIKVIQEVDIKTLHVNAGVRYWEDAIIDGISDEGNIPCREGEYWCPVINVESGIITNWTKGVTAEIYYKLCDDGTYSLRDEAGRTWFVKEDYVPSCLCPKENGYGNYIIMDIDADGKIANWVFKYKDLIEEEN